MGAARREREALNLDRREDTVEFREKSFADEKGRGNKSGVQPGLCAFA